MARSRLECLTACPFGPPAESDARYGSFDFRAAHAEAEADLRELLDGTESLVSFVCSPLCLCLLLQLFLGAYCFLFASPSVGEATSEMGC